MPSVIPLKDAAGVNAVLFTGSGRNFDWSLTLQDKAGVAVDISGWTIQAILKQNISDADAAALMTEQNCSVTDGPNGVFTVPLAAATINGAADDALLILWRVVDSTKKILCQYYVDVLESALD